MEHKKEVEGRQRGKFRTDIDYAALISSSDEENDNIPHTDSNLAGGGGGYLMGRDRADTIEL